MIQPSLLQVDLINPFLSHILWKCGNSHQTIRDRCLIRSYKQDNIRADTIQTQIHKEDWHTIMKRIWIIKHHITRTSMMIILISTLQANLKYKRALEAINIVNMIWQAEVHWLRSSMAQQLICMSSTLHQDNWKEMDLLKEVLELWEYIINQRIVASLLLIDQQVQDLIELSLNNSLEHWKRLSLYKER